MKHTHTHTHTVAIRPAASLQILNNAWDAPGDYSGLQIGLAEMLLPAISLREYTSWRKHKAIN